MEDANGHRSTTVYDAAGRAVAAVNALGNRTTTMFDAVGNTQALIDARGNRHSFLYDAAREFPSQNAVVGCFRSAYGVTPAAPTGPRIPQLVLS